MQVAYVFSTAGQTIDYILGDMILPQLEAGCHGVDVAGMFFFHDNTFILQEDDPLGARLASVAEERDIHLILCNRCAHKRGLADEVESDDDSRPRYVARNTYDGVTVGCFPDLYEGLSDVDLDHIITL